MGGTHLVNTMVDQGIHKGKSNVLQNEKQKEIIHGYSIHEM